MLDKFYCKHLTLFFPDKKVNSFKFKLICRIVVKNVFEK